MFKEARTRGSVFEDKRLKLFNEPVHEEARLDVTVSYMAKYVVKRVLTSVFEDKKTEGPHVRKGENIKSICLWMPEYQKRIKNKACVREWERHYWKSLGSNHEPIAHHFQMINRGQFALLTKYSNSLSGYRH
jgi:hypothetical protein